MLLFYRFSWKNEKNSPHRTLTHKTPVCTANLLFILNLCSLPFAGLVFVCFDSEVVYSMFQFFAVVLFLSSLLLVLRVAFFYI